MERQIITAGRTARFLERTYGYLDGTGLTRMILSGRFIILEIMGLLLLMKISLMMQS